MTKQTYHIQKVSASSFPNTFKEVKNNGIYANANVVYVANRLIKGGKSVEFIGSASTQHDAKTMCHHHAKNRLKTTNEMIVFLKEQNKPIIKIYEEKNMLLKRGI